MGCNMIVVGSQTDSPQDLKGFGFFSNAVYDDETGGFLGCVRYSEYLTDKTKDTGFKLGRMSAILLGIFITLATLVCLLVQCFNKHGKTCLWAFMTWSYVAAFVCQGGAFLIMMTDLCDEYEGEEYQCRLGGNGITSIINGVLLFGMVIATCNSSPPRNPVFRCWYAAGEECDTDESDEDDVENPTKSLSRSAKRGSTKRGSDDNEESVSLFGSNHSKKSWLSFGPKLTVKQKVKNLEGKHLWPMNQMKSPELESRAAPAPKKQGNDEEVVDPRVQTYYRTQRSVFKRFEATKNPDTVKHVDTLQTDSGSTEGSVASLKAKAASSGEDFTTKDSMPRSTAVESAIVNRSIPYNAYTTSVEKEEGIETPLAQAYLRQLRPHQAVNETPEPEAEEEPEEVASVKSGSVKSGSVKSGSVKSGSAKSGSVKGRSIKSGSAKTDTVKSNGSANSSVKSNRSSGSRGGESSINSIGSDSTASTFLVQQLAATVILGKGGVRKEKTTIGKTMKIVDEYPASAESLSKRKEGSKRSSAAPIVKVRTEYCPEGRKTVMDEARPDGTRVVTTLIDPLTIDEQLGL
jgi:hypothetical protein